MGALRANRSFGRGPRVLATGLVATLVIAWAGNVPAHATAPVDAQLHARSFTIAGDTPAPVASRTAPPQRRHDLGAVLSLNIGLAVHDSAGLDAVIRAASTPGSTEFGHYLTPAQYMARFAPSDAEVAAVRQWLTGEGVRVTGVSSDHLIVSAQAATATAERAFGVTVNDYRSGPRPFFSNDVAPSVPAGLAVHWVSGLSNFDVLKSFADPAPAPDVRSGGYRPSDFQQGYNVNGVLLAPAHRANDESIGFTLWGAPLLQADLTAFATNTGSPQVTVTASGTPASDQIKFIPCSVSSCTAVSADPHTNAWDETAMDVESGHGVAPGSHLKYWLASMSVQGVLEPDFQAVENALSAAANDPTVTVVSNSWGFGVDANDPTMDASLQHAAAVGKTFFFSSGDSAGISYPATSPYVVSVGGTNLNLDGSFNYASESAWDLSGNGCSKVFGRPSWQVGVGAATCGGRAEPDVAADGAPATGAYVFYAGGHQQIGGTSLSAPLWAGMTAVWNEALHQALRPAVGFVAPALSSIANNPSVYQTDFHDVRSGSAGGHAAGPGWDEVTGWGSPNLAKLVAQYINQIPTTTTLTASPNPLAIGHSVVFTATVSPAPASGTVAFRQNGVTIGGCGSVAPASGRAHCTVEYGQAGTYRVQAAFSGNASLAGNVGNTLFEHVDPVPAPPAGYWMVGSTGDVYAFGTSKWAGNAKTTGVTHFEPIPSRHGYWIVNRAGQVYAFGDAPALGNASGLGAGETVSSLSSTPSGKGYWLFTSRGRALRFGDAQFFGDLSGRALNRPVIGSVATPSGRGYYMVASDGGIFSFGDAAFYGSTGGIRLNQPVNGLVPTPTNRGYWMVASDGGIFAFGDAGFHGSMGGTRLNKPVVGLVRYGNGYLMVGSDGGIFDFSDKPFLGSLAGKPLAAPIVSVAS
jgi:Pro-kumamolisin, activation domain/Bacterial Ig-like domain (group 3)